LPTKKEKLREKVLRRSGLRPQDPKKKKKVKKPDDVQSQSAVSGVSGMSKETDNSVERRKEEE
jgi:hypothetical protein